MARWFTVVGLLLTAAGIYLAASALIIDWKAHGQGRPLLPWLVTARRWVERRVLGRQPEVVTGSASVVLPKITASGYGYAVLPADAPVERQIEYLREQVRELHNRIGEQGTALRQDIGKVHDQVVQASSEAQSAVAQVEQMARDIATGTTHRQLFGLLLVGAGSFIGALPALFGLS